MSKFLSKYAFSKDGQLDLETAVETFKKDLKSFWDTEMSQLVKIQGSIMGLFQKYPGVRMNIPYIVSSVCVELGVTPESHPVMSKKTEDVIHALIEQGTIVSTKGKGGGCALAKK